LGRQFKVTAQRGKIMNLPDGPAALATYHPSGILRAPDEDERRRKRNELVHDLRIAAKRLG
jgi:DNA polymerase